MVWRVVEGVDPTFLLAFYRISHGLHPPYPPYPPYSPLYKVYIPYTLGEKGTKMVETIGTVLDRIETKQAPHHQRMVGENVEIGPNDLSIDLLRAVYRNNALPLHTRMRAAMSALKHEVPTLGISVVVNADDMATRLDRALARIAAIKSNDHINGEPVVTEPTFQPEPQSPPPTSNPLSRLYSPKFRRRI
jgi:hypothetical protein